MLSATVEARTNNIEILKRMNIIQGLAMSMLLQSRISVSEFLLNVS